MGKPLVVALLLIGFLLAPGYYVYVRHFSGQLQTTLTLPMAGTKIGAVDIHLAPEMNPVGLVLRFSAAHGATAHPPNVPQYDYRVQLMDGERTVLDDRFSLVATSVESAPAVVYQQALPVFEVDRAAVYRLILQGEGDGQMQINSVDVLVRAAVRKLDLRLIVLGGIMLILGVIGWVRR